MSSIMTLKIPLIDSITRDDILSLAELWGKKSPYYNFENSSLSREEFSSTTRSEKSGNIARLDHCEYQDEKTDKLYIALRIDTQDDHNLLWRADIIFMLSKTENNYALIRMDRSIQNPEFPADLSEKIKYPTILNILWDMHYVKCDISEYSRQAIHLSNLSPENRHFLKTTFQIRKKTDLPFIYFYVPREFLPAEQKTSKPSNNENFTLTGLKWDKSKDGFTGLVHFLAYIGYVYIAEGPEENDLWNQLTSGGQDTASPKTFYRAEVVYPYLNLTNYLPITTDLDGDQLYRHIILMLQACQQVIPLDTPDWDDINNWIIQKEKENSASSYYLKMNEQIAQHIQNTRKQKGLTQEELAEKVDVTKMLISRLERLQTIRVKRELIVCLEGALEMEEGELTRLE